MSINDKVLVILIIDSESNILSYKDTLKEIPKCEFLYSDDYLTQIELIKQKRIDAILINIKLLTENKHAELSLVKKQFKEYGIPTYFFRPKVGQEIIIETVINSSLTLPDLMLIGDLVLSVKDSNLHQAIINTQPKPENLPNEVKDNISVHDSSEINQLKAVFIRNITYEIRTLLNNVGGPIQLIKEKIDDPELIPFFSIIDTTLNRMVEFTFKATLSSDLKLGNYPIKKSLINLDEILRFSALELTEFLELERIKLTVNPTRTSASIYGDKDLLFHTFTAILDKTINLTKENGEIFIDFSLGKGTVDCKITTNRISFNKQDILEIFNSTSIDQEIGLSLAKMVLNIHDGFYWVDTTKETGVTIGISFKTSEHE